MFFCKNIGYLFFFFCQICIAMHIQIQAEKINHLSPLVQSKFKRCLHILFIDSLKWLQYTIVFTNIYKNRLLFTYKKKNGETPYGGSSHHSLSCIIVMMMMMIIIIIRIVDFTNVIHVEIQFSSSNRGISLANRVIHASFLMYS